MTFRSVTGPTPCTSDRDAILSTRHFLAGTAARFLLDLQRSDGSIRLAFYDFGYLDRPYVEYAGDVADGEVSAASPVETGHIVCSGVRFDYCGRRARQGALLGERSFAHG